MTRGAAMQLPNAERWKSRAAQVRRLAESMDPDPARDVLLAIARQYEEAAQRYSVEATGSGLERLVPSFHV
jgi:hypothetical protein